MSITGVANPATPACLTLLDRQTETPQYQPEAPSLSMQRQTVVFHSQRAMKSQMYASLEKPH